MKFDKIFAFLLLLLLVLMSCNNSTSKIHKNPEEYLIKELKNKRILMLGDFGHGQPLPFYSIIELLNKWASMVEDGADVDKHIVLILETDSAGVNSLKTYFKTNDLMPLFNKWPSYNIATLEQYEFFADLRRFSMKIDSMNSRPAGPQGITFDIFGPEGAPVWNPHDSLDELSKDRLDYFIEKRDVLTARNITEYLNAFNNAKAIIFYGNAHLNKAFAEKNIFPNKTSKNENTKGYFLAHYLKSSFGNGMVLSVNQTLVDSQRMKPSVAEKVGNENFYIETGSSFRKTILFPAYDGFIVRREHFVYGHEINKIISKYVINSCILRMDSLLTDTTNAILKQNYLKTVKWLPYLCGMNYEYPVKPEMWFRTNKPAVVVHEWKEWFRKNESTIEQRIGSKNFEDVLKQMYIRSLKTKNTKELQSIGFSERAWDFSGFSDAQWDSLIWPEAMDRIKCINSIGQLWFGDSAEQKTAHAFLVNYTAKDFSDPSLYLKWFRSQKDGVVY
jgi:hypothetical protein